MFLKNSAPNMDIWMFSGKENWFLNPPTDKREEDCVY